LRETAFTLEPSLLGFMPPFRCAHAPERAGLWLVTDAQGWIAARAKTRAGGRLAVRALYAALDAAKRRAA
jgi:hypothetical protein